MVVRINPTQLTRSFFEENILTLDNGDIILLDNVDYETLNQCILSFKDEGSTFEVAYCPPGSSIYNMYGRNLVVDVVAVVSN